MKEIEKKMHLDRYKTGIEWLKQTLPSDEIYEFAELALVACDYFVKKISEITDLEKEAKRDKVFESWIQNIGALRVFRDPHGKPFE